MVETIADPGNINIIAFLYLFGGLIGMMQISGGVKGFSEWASEKIGSERGLLSAIWLTLPFTFMMPMFRIMMIGPVVKSLLKKLICPAGKSVLQWISRLVQSLCYYQLQRHL